MNRIRATFDELRERGEAALVVYLMGGFPDVEASMRALQAVDEAGADVIELGIPFSDPVADGPTIQQAAHDALAAGAGLRKILKALERTAWSRPISLMSYLNPLESYGRDELLDRLAAIGVAGLIVPDLPLEEAEGWAVAARDRGLALTLLAAPTSTEDRIRAIAEVSDGFVYYVSLTGVTGARQDLPADVLDGLARVRKATTKPVAVGFGISTPDHVRRLRGHADGVIVGSRIVRALRGGEDLAALVRELKSATKE